VSLAIVREMLFRKAEEVRLGEAKWLVQGHITFKRIKSILGCESPVHLTPNAVFQNSEVLFTPLPNFLITI
jgi:hypothetical protein